MKTLSVKSLIAFREKSPKGKRSFAAAVKLDKPEADNEGGGDYWISSLSAVSNGFKTNDVQPIIDKRAELEYKHEHAVNARTKTMYGRNIGILYNFEDFRLEKWRPAKKMAFLRRNRNDSILTIRGLQVQALPHHVFTFGKNERKEIGAIWFVARLGGFEKEELGMFTDALYRYLKTNFSKEYDLSPDYCIAVDVVSKHAISYAQMEAREVPSILISTLNEVRSFM